jgi:hypothetical protein
LQAFDLLLDPINFGHGNLQRIVNREKRLVVPVDYRTKKQKRLSRFAGDSR